MARVIVTTDDGLEVWALEGIEPWHINALQCPGNARGSSLASGVRRAVQDAEAIQAGRDPELPSEKAMRMSLRPLPGETARDVIERVTAAAHEEGE